MHRPKILSLLLLLTLLCACKKDNKQDAGQLPDATTGTAKPLPAPASRFEPQSKSTGTLGTVVFNGDTLTVTEEYTDGVAFVQDVSEPSGAPNVLNYREKLVHLISKKTGDTITLNKAFFKKDIPDYDNMILQGVLFNMKLKAGSVPLLVYFCQPDTDYCYHFDVRLTTAGKITVKEVDEEDFDDYEE